MGLKDDLGFGLLLKRYTNDIAAATPEQIKQAAANTIPGVAPMLWSFRLMVGSGIAMLLIFGLGVFFSMKRTLEEKKWFLKLALLALPCPGSPAKRVGSSPRIRPSALDDLQRAPRTSPSSSLSAGEVLGSIIGFVILYSALLVVEMWLMIRFGRKGAQLASVRAATTLNVSNPTTRSFSNDRL